MKTRPREGSRSLVPVMSVSAATATGHAKDPPTADRADTFAVLQAISADLGAGRPERVAALLETLPDRGGVLGRALLGIARGLEAEADGRGEDAARLMEEAFGRSPTLPATMRASVIVPAATAITAATAAVGRSWSLNRS